MGNIGSLLSGPMGGALFQSKGLFGVAKDAMDDTPPPPPPAQTIATAAPAAPKPVRPQTLAGRQRKAPADQSYG